MDQATTILLVEDNQDDVFLMERALRKAAIANPIQVVNDGGSAIDYLAGKGRFAVRENFPLPGLIFLDLKLPYFDGFEVLEWMRAQPALSSTMVVILSSSGESRDRERANALGVRSYLVKPPTPDKLIALMVSI
jgi:CheY-like chemotaxis protein